MQYLIKEFHCDSKVKFALLFSCSGNKTSDRGTGRFIQVQAPNLHHEHKGQNSSYQALILVAGNQQIVRTSDFTKAKPTHLHLNMFVTPASDHEQIKSVQSDTTTRLYNPNDCNRWI